MRAEGPPNIGTQRLFFAVFPPIEVQTEAARAVESMRAAGPPSHVAWVKRQNLHFTLRFLGDCDEEMVTRAQRALAVVEPAAPFQARLDGYGAFPTAARAQVLWVGMSHGATPLRALAAALESEVAAAGFGRSDKPFMPHLTLGRMRVATDWAQALAGAPPLASGFAVDRVVLVRSTLAQGGSRYERLAETTLQGAVRQ